MSIDRRNFINGVAGGFLSYDFLKLNLVKSLRETHPSVAETGGTYNPQTDIDLGGIFHRLGQPALVIQLDTPAHPDDTIKPGQPISLTWSVYDLFTTFPQRPNERYSSSQITFLDRGNPIFGPTTQRRLSILPDALHNDFYHVDNYNEVTAELSNTPGGVAVNGSFHLLVVRDNAPSWEWVDLASRYQWNRDHYTPTGILHNNAHHASLAFTPTLIQVDRGETAAPLPAARFALAPLSISHNGIANLPFPTIHQDWPWFDRATLYPFGPIVRGFNYSVDITGTDTFGNVYAATSETRDVIVAVAIEKSIEEGVAFAAQIAAVILAAVGIFYPAVLVVAGAFQTIAAVAVMGALDPPEPDFDYFTLVHQEVKSASDSAPAAVRLVSLILQIAAVPLTLSAIESKLLGANLSNSAEGLARQQQSYGEAIRQMNASARQLEKALPAALLELHSRPEVNDKNIQSGRKILAKGISPEILRPMRLAGLSKDAEIMLGKAVSNPEMMKQLPDLDTALTNVVKQAALLTLTLQNEMPKVLRQKPKNVLKERN